MHSPLLITSPKRLLHTWISPPETMCTHCTPFYTALSLVCFFDKWVWRTRVHFPICAARRKEHSLHFSICAVSNPLWVPLSFRYWLADYDNSASFILFEPAWRTRQSSPVRLQRNETKSWLHNLHWKSYVNTSQFLPFWRVEICTMQM